MHLGRWVGLTCRDDGLAIGPSKIGWRLDRRRLLCLPALLAPSVDEESHSLCDGLGQQWWHGIAYLSVTRMCLPSVDAARQGTTPRVGGEHEVVRERL